MSNVRITLQSAETGGTNEWVTPWAVYDTLDAEFQFGLDACAADIEMARHPNFISPAEDALSPMLTWFERSNGAPVFVNPPYGRDIAEWFKRASTEAALGCTVVMLVYANTDTVYWHDYVFPLASEIRFVRGRIQFVAGQDIYKPGPNGPVLSLKRGDRGPATRPSAVVIYRPGDCPGFPKMSTVQFPAHSTAA